MAARRATGRSSAASGATATTQALRSGSTSPETGWRNGRCDGADGDRTRDLQSATLALSQLSYGPKAAQFSLEFERRRPVDAELLVVPRWAHAQSDGGSAFEEVERKEVARVEVGAVDGECVDLTAVVSSPQEPVARPAGRVGPDDDEVTLKRRPFALDADEVVSDAEHHVAAAALEDRAVDVDSQLGCSQRDRGFRDVSLLIGRQHRRPFSCLIRPQTRPRLRPARRSGHRPRAPRGGSTPAPLE